MGFFKNYKSEYLTSKPVSNIYYKKVPEFENNKLKVFYGSKLFDGKEDKKSCVETISDYESTYDYSDSEIGNTLSESFDESIDF